MYFFRFSGNNVLWKWISILRISFPWKGITKKTTSRKQKAHCFFFFFSGPFFSLVLFRKLPFHVLQNSALDVFHVFTKYSAFVWWRFSRVLTKILLCFGRVFHVLWQFLKRQPGCFFKRSFFHLTGFVFICFFQVF